MGAKRVKFENLNKIFLTDDDRQVKAVDNFNLDINPGEFVCLLGPSGCGKTTTLRMLAGFEIPTDGHIYIGDENVERITPDKRDTAMVFQNYALFPHMNVFDNIAYGLKLQKLSKIEINERVNKILSLMKMEDFANRVPSQMSGGQQQRVSLARALVMEPGVLLFDEPLSNLDAKLRIHMRDEIRKIQQEVGITSIYVTHDQSEAMGLSDKIVIMKDGKIQQVGSPIDVYQRPINEFVANFIGKANIFSAIVLESSETSTIVKIFEKEYKIEHNEKLEINSTVKVLARPETILIGASEMNGLVTRSMFMGGHHEYEIFIDSNFKIEVSLNNPMNKKIYRVGEKIEFGLDINSLHIIKE